MTTGGGHRSEYLPALDGLRALAVAAVIAYHLGLPWARGGYYYGSSWSYYYPGPYYGGPYYTAGGRLPYVCGLYGYCF